MPLKVIDPRTGKTPYYSIRGTYLGVYVNRSVKTRKRAVATQALKKIERDIEEGQFAVKGELTFAQAAMAYMKSGGERKYVGKLLRHFGDLPLRHIGQQQVDAAAEVLYPEGSPATRNRSVHAIVSAISSRSDAPIRLRRPVGSGGNKQTAWLNPEQAERLFTEAQKIDKDFASLLMTLCYTGMRLSEALGMAWENVRADEGYAYIPTTKNDEPRAVFLPARVVASLPTQSPRRDRVFRFSKSGHLYSLLRMTAARAGVSLPERSAFHLFRHTYASWMRRFAGADSKALLATGAWKDHKSVDRYVHTVASEESKLAALLPGAENPWKPIAKSKKGRNINDK